MIWHLIYLWLTFFYISGQSDSVLTFSDAEDTINDSELQDFKEDGVDIEMQLADRYIIFLVCVWFKIVNILIYVLLKYYSVC